MSSATSTRLASRRGNSRFLIPIALGLLLVFSAHTAPAIDLVMSFDLATSDKPKFDLDGSKLKTMMQAVESYWEDIFEAPGMLNVKFFYDDLTGEDTLADHTSLATIGTKPGACQIRVDTTVAGNDRLWYFDDTPMDNSEYKMHQVLASDLTDEEKADWFKGTPNDLLEVGYLGEFDESAPEAAKSGCDLFGVLLHETGHGLGMNEAVAAGETKDLLYNFDRDLVWNRSLSAKCASEDDRYHLKAGFTRMQSGASAGLRILPSAVDVFAIQTSCNWRDTTIDLPRKDFYNSHPVADWSVARNWEGNRTPDSADDAYVCHGGDATLSSDATAGNLTIDAGSEVLVGSHKLAVTNATIVGNGVNAAAISILAPEGRLETDSLIISDNASVSLGDGARIDATDLKIYSGGTLAIQLGELALDAEFHFVDLSGRAILGGILDIGLSGGFMPEIGDEFTIMTFDSLDGDFGLYEGLDLGGGLVLDPSLTANSLVLVTSAMAAPTAVPEPSSAILLAGLLGGLALLVRRPAPGGPNTRARRLSQCLRPHA